MDLRIYREGQTGLCASGKRRDFHLRMLYLHRAPSGWKTLFTFLSSLPRGRRIGVGAELYCSSNVLQESGRRATGSVPMESMLTLWRAALEVRTTKVDYSLVDEADQDTMTLAFVEFTD